MSVAIGIDIVNRVIDDIAVSVMALWIIELWYKWVWADEAAKLRIIVPAAIVVEAAFRIKDLAVRKESL